MPLCVCPDKFKEATSHLPVEFLRDGKLVEMYVCRCDRCKKFFRGDGTVNDWQEFVPLFCVCGCDDELDSCHSAWCPVCDIMKKLLE